MSDAQYATPEFEDTPKRISAVWLLPIIAVAIAFGLVWKTYTDQGPLITIQFPSAAGMEKGSTALRFRDVDVGVVEDIDLASGFAAVDVHVRVDKKIAPYLDSDAEFWLVEPRVTTRGVSGLGTVLSGVYIEGNWDDKASEEKRHFVALPDAPLSAAGENGTRIMLRSRNGGHFSAGAPVLFSGVEVGRLGAPKLAEIGSAITVEAFIAAPHDQRLNTNTRFWNSSGISLNVGAGGLSVDVESLAALVEGGVSFSTLATGGKAIAPGHVFDIFDNERTARENVFEGDAGSSVALSVLLDSDVAGLNVGSSVKYRGLKLGEISHITGFAGKGTSKVRLLVDFTIRPAGLGLPPVADPSAQIEQIAARIAVGLRARVASEGLLGQTIFLELLDDPDAAPAVLDVDQTPLPLVPVVAPATKDATATVEGLAKRVGALPIEELMSSAIGALDSVTALVSSPDMRQLPVSANGLMTETAAMVAGAETKQALADLQKAAADLAAITSRIQQSDGIPTLLTALEKSDAIAEDIGSFSARLPALADGAETVTTNFGSLPMSELVADASAAVAQLDALLSDDYAAAIAPSVAGASQSLERILKDFDDSRLIESLNTTAASADGLIGDLRTSTEGIPALIQDANKVVAAIARMPLEEVSTSLDQLLIRTTALLNAPGIEDIPVALRDSLTELQATMQELRRGGAVENLNKTLASADKAMASIETATSQMPALMRRLNDLAQTLETTAAGYAPNSKVNRELRATISEIGRTAEAFRSLARTIERNPNALITGR